jgi:hypothetical protein
VICTAAAYIFLSKGRQAGRQAGGPVCQAGSHWRASCEGWWRAVASARPGLAVLIPLPPQHSCALDLSVPQGCCCADAPSHWLALSLAGFIGHRCEQRRGHQTQQFFPAMCLGLWLPWSLADGSLLLRVSRLAAKHSEQQRQTTTSCMPRQDCPTTK